MFSHNYLPLLVSCQVDAPPDTLDVNAKRSEDGQTLVLQAVNSTDQAIPAPIHLAGFVPKKPVAQVTELAGLLDAVNTAAEPQAIVPQSREWKHEIAGGQTNYTFPPRSVTVLRLE